jgi:ABC-type transport system involved in multi-copper enzyme maturation permease subunit
MLQKLLLIELTRLVKNTMLRIELAILAAAVVGMNGILFIAGRIAPENASLADAAVGWPGALEQALGFGSAGGLGGVLMIVLASALMTQSYQWRTLHFWLGRGAPRGTFLLARFFSLVLPALLFAAAALIAGAISSLLIAWVGGRPVFGGPHLPHTLLAVLRTAYTLLPYAALALLLGVATRSTAAAVGIGIGWILLGETVLAQMLGLIGGMAGAAAKLLPSSMAMSLMRANSSMVDGAGGMQEAVGASDTLAAAFGLALYAVLYLAIAAVLLRRQDITG